MLAHLVAIVDLVRNTFLQGSVPAVGIALLVADPGVAHPGITIGVICASALCLE